MYTLEDLLSDGPASVARHVCGGGDFSRVQIEAITVLELPLDDFVRPAQVILTTAIGCMEDDDVFKGFIRRVRESCASALFVALRDEGAEISREVLAYGEELGLPIFMLPWKLHFADIIAHVAQKLGEGRLSLLRQIRAKLMGAYFSSKGFDDACRIIHTFVGAPVVIRDKKGTARGSFFIEAPDSEPDSFDIAEGSFLMGRLDIYTTERSAAFTANAELVRDYIALPLTMWFDRENIEDMMLVKMRSDFVWDLAQNSWQSFEETASLGARLGFDLFSPCVCVSSRVVDGDDPAPDAFSIDGVSLTLAVEDMIRAARGSIPAGVMFASRGMSFIAYVSSRDGRAKHHAANFVASLSERFARRYPRLALRSGISDVSKQDPPEFDLLASSASLALEYCVSAGTAASFTYRDTEFQRAIGALSASDDIRGDAQKILALLTDGRSSTMDLVVTLTQFIKNGGNASETARSMGLHRQSLLYRIAKIEELTGMSLKDRRDLFLLEIYTRIFFDY